MPPTLVPETGGAGPRITGFAEGGFRIDGEIYRAGALLTPHRVIAWDAPVLNALSEADFGDVLALDPVPEFLLLGTGAGMAHPARSLVEAIEARGIGIEAMDSRAAARAWGVLRAEQRWIVAALLPLQR